MARKRTIIARRAWKVLGLALLWARKGGAFKRGLMIELRVLPNYIKSLRRANTHKSIHYNAREFTFDETPLFDFKMHRPNSMRFHMPSLPCLKPQVDFDDFDYNDNNERQEEEEVNYGFQHYDNERLNDHEMVQVDDECIDSKAEEFIAKFYEQMKMQRQISYLECDDMLN